MSELSASSPGTSQTNVGEIYSIELLRGVSGRVCGSCSPAAKERSRCRAADFKNIYNDNRVSGAKMLSAMFYLEPVPPPVTPPVTP